MHLAHRLRRALAVADVAGFLEDPWSRGERVQSRVRERGIAVVAARTDCSRGWEHGVVSGHRIALDVDDRRSQAGRQREELGVLLVTDGAVPEVSGEANLGVVVRG